MLDAIYDKDFLAHQLLSDPPKLITYVENDQADTEELLTFTSARQEVQSLRKRWNELPKDLGADERDALEREYNETKQRLHNWEQGDGRRLEFQAIDLLRVIFPDLPSALASNPIEACNVALNRTATEKERCDRVLSASTRAAETTRSIEAELAKIEGRIADRTAQLEAQTADLLSGQAQALANILPHIHDENCPVCGRDFKEVNKAPLSAHVSALIASLTSKAGRLTASTSAQAGDLTQKAALERSLFSVAQSSLLPPEDLSDLALRIAVLQEGVTKLNPLAEAASAGAELMRANAVAAAKVAEANNRNNLADQLASQAATWQQNLAQYLAQTTFSVGELLAELTRTATERITSLREREKSGDRWYAD